MAASSLANGYARRGFMTAVLSAIGVAASTGRARAFTSSGWDMVQAILNHYVDSGQLPGAVVAISQHDAAPCYLKAGNTAFGGKVPINEHSLFRIYSMTKPITGTAAAILIGEGRLGLDQPVAEILPEFGSARVVLDAARGLGATPSPVPMTIRHLLTHTAGLTYHFETENAVTREYRRQGIMPIPGYNLAPLPIDGFRPETLEQFSSRLAAIPLIAVPGTAMHYSVSLDLLGAVIQKTSGMPFHQFVTERLLVPAGMVDTRWTLAADDRTRLVDMTRLKPGGGSDWGSTDISDAYFAPLGIAYGGAGLVSTAADYWRFLAMLMGDGRIDGRSVLGSSVARLVSSDLTAAMLPGNGNGHGCGGSVVRAGDTDTAGKMPGSFGWSGAAGTDGYFDPVRKLCVVLMVQYFGDGDTRLQPEQLL